MKLITSKLTALFLLTLFVGGFTLTSCKKKGDPPTIPPQETFAMDFSQFPEDNSGKTGKIVADSTSNNFAFSAITVVVWQTVVTITLAIPVLAFAESFNHSAKYVRKQHKWLWEYSVTDGWGNTYNAKLYGEVVDDNVNWEMYLSKVGGYQDFLWYEGVSKLDNSEGTWTLNKDPNNAMEFVGIVWHRNEDGTSDIKYTNIESGSAENGGYIEYGLTNETQFNAFYNVFVKSTTNLTEIDWNTTSHIGQVRNQTHFGDNLLHCWDGTLQDTDCNNL